jgi:hypothetical protein
MHLNDYLEHDVAGQALTCAFPLSAKGRSGEVVAWPYHTTEASVPLAREKNTHDKQSDSWVTRLLPERSFVYGSCPDRGIFEVAPRCAVRVRGCIVGREVEDVEEKRQGCL